MQALLDADALLLDATDRNGRTALMIAARYVCYGEELLAIAPP